MKTEKLESIIIIFLVVEIIFMSYCYYLFYITENNLAVVVVIRLFVGFGLLATVLDGVFSGSIEDDHRWLGVVAIIGLYIIPGILLLFYKKLSLSSIENGKDKTLGKTNSPNDELYSCVDSNKKSIYFGSYPQAKIEDENLILELSEKAGILPTKSNTYSWTDYGYYIEGKVESCMYYIDIELEGNKYRGVYFTQYRSYYTGTTSSNTFQDDNGYSTKSTYWFKYEPIKWDILKTENNKALIISDLILDSQDYYYSESSRSGATDYQGNITNSTIYANNYMYSRIRSWLNETFYETAFSTLEKEIIETTTVDNSASSTRSETNKYACGNTSDKLFLLSYKEAKTSYSSNSKRQAKGTDYAKSQGLYVYNDNSCYWLRSPNYYYDFVDYACDVHDDGFIDYDYVGLTHSGVRPACWINLKSKQNKIVSKNEILNQKDVDDKKVLNPILDKPNLNNINVKDEVLDNSYRNTNDEILDKPKDELYSYVDSSKKSIYFGSYPQAKIEDENLILELSEKAGILPTKSNTYNWTDYGYYIEGKVESYMYYIDIELEGNKYRGVYFTQYRPYYTTTTSTNTNQDDNGYNTKTTYWFKYEPIIWNILTTKNGKALIIGDLILDSQDYNYTYNKRSKATDYNGNSTRGTIYANNYMYSHIRNWLNKTFYKTAFSTLEKKIIVTTTVDNSASSTGDRLNLYACSDTRDKMFLLSYKEYYSNTVRQAKGSDYAKSQGLYVSGESSHSSYSDYWLRSPNDSYDYYASIVYSGGRICGNGVDLTCNGVRPACWINLKSKQNNIDIKDEILDKCNLDNKKVSNPILDKPKIDLQKNVGKSNITSRYYIKAVGVTFGNRQQIISRLKPGDKLKFVPEPNNSYDRFAIQITTLDGQQIGYVSKDYNQGIFKKIQAGQKYNLSVECITGGGYNLAYGVNILVKEIQ